MPYMGGSLCVGLSKKGLYNIRKESLIQIKCMVQTLSQNTKQNLLTKREPN